MNILSYRLLPVFFIACVFLQSCSVTDPKDPRFVVAKGNGVEITRGELTDSENQFLAPQQMTVDTFPKERIAMLDTRVLKELIIKKLLLDQAQQVNTGDLDKETDAKYQEIVAHFPNADNFKAELKKRNLSESRLKKEIHDQLAIQAVLTKNVPPTGAVSEADINKFYDENKDKFVRTDVAIRASHILVMVPPGTTPEVKEQKRKAIEAAHTRVLKGEDFAKVAQEVSEDKGSAPKGGDLDYFQKGQMVPAFEKVAFSTKPGTVSEVFETPYGFHFLKVIDIKPAGKITLAEVHDKIAEFLKNKQHTIDVQAYLKKMQDDANIKYSIPMEPPQLPTAAAPPLPPNEAAVPAGSTTASAPPAPATPPAPVTTKKPAKH